MFKRKDSSHRLVELEAEIKQLKREIETLRRQNDELRETNNKLKQSVDESVKLAVLKEIALGKLIPIGNSQSQASSDTAAISSTDSELQRQLNSAIQQLSETRKQLLNVQDQLTVSQQVTAATQRRELVQEGVYENLPTDSVYEELRFDPTQEHVYAKLQLPTHSGCKPILVFCQ